MARNNSNSDGPGCGCLILILLVIIVVWHNKDSDNKSEESSHQKEMVDSKYARQQPTYSQESSSEYRQLEKPYSEEERKYMGNFLPTGSQPYKNVYGRNYSCPDPQCSGIQVTAPVNSDVIVTIKRNNENGKVIAHGYIHAGDTYKFDVPNGTFQTFFYIGEGWNPNKVVKEGILGGFVKENGVSKDYPQEVYDAVLSYVLQLQRDGNFQTKGSNKEEMF